MASGRLKTRRWNDPSERDDGLRVLITRYRPRGLKKADETWDVWIKDVAPSAQLLADFHGKEAAPISWSEYRKRYLHEMKSQTKLIASLKHRLEEGETVTLLCSSACTDPEHCHRALLKELVEKA
jgi:uncharacterized protein YeaO (DUF488 family)